MNGKRLRRWTIGLLILACAFAPVSLADAAHYNADFSIIAEDATLPEGWQFDAWYMDETSSAYVEGDAVVLINHGENDARIVQRIEAEPDTLYRFTCTAEAADVSGAAGASISVLDTFASSEQLFGDEGETTLSLIGRTGPKQTEFTLALRLGGYGALASGTARFSNITMEVLDAAPAGAEVFDFAPLEAEESVQEESAPGTSAFLLFLALGTLSLLGYWILYRREIAGGSAEEAGSRTFLLLFAAAILIRILLSLLIVGHSIDLACFLGWSDAMAAYGPAEFYTSVGFADYPPGYFYLLWPLGELRQLLGLEYWSPLTILLIKLPGIAAELFTAYYACRFTRLKGAPGKEALVVFSLLAFSPAFAFLSAGWGQIDSILALLLLFVALLFSRGQKILAGALYGLAILLKPQALMLGPLLAFAYLWPLVAKRSASAPQRLHPILETCLAVAAAVAIILLGALPFASEDLLPFLLEKYFSTATSYPYASVEAYNLFALVGGNWAPITDTLLGLPYSLWGTIGIALSVLAACFLYYKAEKAAVQPGPGPLLLAGAFLLAGVFTLGHFMHERYLYPALVLLLFACLAYDDRRLYLAFAWLSTTLLLNSLGAFLIVDHQHLRGTAYDLFTVAGSLATVGGFGYLAYVSYSLILRGEQRPTALFGALPIEEAPEEEEEGDETFESLPPLEPLAFESGRTRLRFSRRDRLFCWGLTAIYAAVALTNLGSMRAPESYYYASMPGESITIRFEEPTALSEYWVFGGIGIGELRIEADTGAGITYEQTYDTMFRWDARDAAALGTVQELRFSVYSGTLWLNEIAFFDAEGTHIRPASIEGPAANPAAASPEMRQSAGAEALIDEPETIPEYPSYYNGMYFDELYHARTAYEHLHGLSPYEISHPPLGKILIMLGIALFGMNPFGWRIIGALFGIAMVPLFYALAKRLFERAEIAFMAAGLFAFDFMHFTQTRIATIDGFAVFFILLMFYFMYEYYTMSFYEDGLRATLRPLGLAGLAFALGAATKWIAIYAGLGLALILLLSLLARFREQREAPPEARAKMQFKKNTIATLAWCCVFYIAVPVAVYLAAYLPYALSEAEYGLMDIVDNQLYMWGYHSGLEATHPYQSAWWEWPFTLRPMWYCLSAEVPEGLLSTLTASGNPAVWWIGTLGSLGLAALIALGRVRVRPGMIVIGIGILANYLPWILISRCTFIYHFFATVPFVLLGAVYLLLYVERRYPKLAWIKWAWLGAGIALFILLYPGLSGLPVSTEWAVFLSKLPGGQLMYGA